MLFLVAISVFKRELLKTCYKQKCHQRSPIRGEHFCETFPAWDKQAVKGHCLESSWFGYSKSLRDVAKNMKSGITATVMVSWDNLNNSGCADHSIYSDGCRWLAEFIHYRRAAPPLLDVVDFCYQLKVLLQIIVYKLASNVHIVFLSFSRSCVF